MQHKSQFNINYLANNYLAIISLHPFPIPCKIEVQLQHDDFLGKF